MQHLSNPNPIGQEGEEYVCRHNVASSREKDALLNGAPGQTSMGFLEYKGCSSREDLCLESSCGARVRASLPFDIVAS